MYIKQAYAGLVQEVDHDIDGWWLYTMPGIYVEYEGLHTIHEDTQREALEVLYTYPVGKCNCAECKKELPLWGMTEADVDALLEKVKKG